MFTEARILKGSTQTLLAYPRVATDAEFLRAQPSAAEVRFGTPAIPLTPTASYAAATVDAVNTTLSSAASEGATSLAIVSAAVKRGRNYLAGDGAGGFDIVESRTEGTATSMRLAEPLNRALASGAAVKGWSITKALPAAQTATDGEAIAEWKVTIDGVVYYFAQPFRIVRRWAVSVLTPNELTKAYPVVRQWRSRQDGDLEELIAAAFEHRVMQWLNAQGIDPETVASSHALRPLHALACLMQLATPNAQVSQETFARIENDWNKCTAGLLDRKDWLDIPRDETATPRPEEQPAVRSGIGLTR